MTMSHAATLGVKEQMATRIALFTAGAVLASWAPIVPYVKTGAALDDAALGLLLLCLGGGSIVAMPLSGAMAQRFGCRAVIAAGSTAFILMLPILAMVPSIFTLAVALFIFGAGIGTVDCVANIQAVMVERASGRTMMSGFHALYSVGGLVGAAVTTAMLALGLTPFTSAILVALAIFALALYAVPGHLPYGAQSSQGTGRSFGIPRGIVIVLSIMAFITFMAEGAALDWGAVFLISARGIDPSVAGLGFISFSLAMVIARFTGDLTVDAFGSTNVVLAGGAMAAFGMGLVALGDHWALALVGFAILGAGCANIVPVLFSAAGRQKTIPESVAIPVLTTVGYSGVLIGPGLIGFAAEATSLHAAFLILAALLAALAIGAKVARV